LRGYEWSSENGDAPDVQTTDVYLPARAVSGEFFLSEEFPSVVFHSITAYILRALLSCTAPVPNCSRTTPTWATRRVAELIATRAPNADAMADASGEVGEENDVQRLGRSSLMRKVLARTDRRFVVLRPLRRPPV